ncbi:hypothetical protein A2630_03345 [Candidatus Woesebacteria bacterium RIFCSPHIGHO2_01_FULL_44_10]|uniref:Type II secretion system protein GspG C-terminal domain-containing protein n=1 Tax=Candidatus Woesebacteria bacterium RIFCSPLOWO2_01_FULL_44_14 TaxID=1802525 RepID=A0A1F8BXQ4_9BACT|nr:MAG: hypothetical protein A2630_03345 [Candidatus Woesebacteria bacterium RIFCSPHIGHO2_01_FULL_44_10]OGM56445.1 MAG: hypothetical protein A3F62_02005 [Candidatus Woesebacteria bacterium RIFCSPHIGHO2_12_FULL_44_11]OGM68847.1 MAG: hypothetical protein A2975_00550 [Candidatus Woesebacteria bacterium RIFCSPLOWO2_01_FULL_44_14]
MDDSRLKGVTLIEILIVATIIAFLAMIALIFTGRTQIFKGRDARRKGDIKKIQVALEEFNSDANCYPAASVVTCGGNGLSPYMEKITCDPLTRTSYLYEPESSSCPRWYTITAQLENEDEPFVAGSPNVPNQ